jgi:hypothetical protein
MSTDMNGFTETSAGEFVHLCLRGRWDEAALETAQAMSQEEGFDWDAVRGGVQREGIAPLLYAIARGRDLLPPALEEELRLAYFSNARRNLLLFHELARVLQQLEAHGIPTIVLKGVALAEAVYGSPAVRPMCDADLLVRREDAPSTLQALAGLGYETPYTDKREGYRFVYGNEVMFCKPGAQDMALDIHWNLFSSPYYLHTLALDWFWETAVPLRIEAVTTWMLGPEAQLLDLCGHLTLHHGSAAPRLLWLHDIAEVLVAYRETFDWERLLNQAQVLDMTLPVRGLLLRVTEEWHIPIPEAALARLRTLEPSAQEVRVFADYTVPYRPFRRSLWDDLASMPNWRVRLDYLWQNLFPSAAYMQSRYAIPRPWLTPLYYPYRWWLGIRTSLQKRRIG